ncbi:MAG: DUF4340 domain-containing protein [Chitinophagales bacterium]|nr:DUF4340 domain-containing protein [Chitinophagales bacterium]
MKKIFSLVILLAALSGIAWYLMQQNKASEKGYVTADRSFSIKNMDEVQKIVIKHTKLQPVIFTRKGKNWILNDKYDVDQDVFVNIEAVLERITLGYIPSKNATPHILKSIKENGIQVDIYTDEDKPSKMFFIGSDTPDGSGTYMVMSGSSQPYVMQLPGLQGGLRSRFEQPAYNYRDKTLFKFKPEDIKSIKVVYTKDNLSSFEITNGNTPTIQPLIAQPTIGKGAAHENNLKFYIQQFERMGTEGIVNSVPEQDSLLAQQPNTILTITTKNGTEHLYKFYSYDHIINEEEDPVTQKEIFGINRQYIYTESDNTLYTAQMRVIRRIFLAYQDFFGQALM